MNSAQKISTLGAVQTTSKCGDITVTEFHAADNRNDLVYAITCACACVSGK